ncbi:glycoside hydrolase family 35 protein [Streptococcus acidominimus]|uniref:Beta-galactosidase n=1 Tax=Streptococcus acidominimus TaxID=1326 RepID=A0A1Q8ECJ9_STRAI|nr:beta-galactosidase family protein [Streptococcus acidominimus]MBF0848377.1 beta-galactosidase [Streptococcus danieliae]MBF0818268.1 beta-galactosidase [Streptococcus acidominimus]MBF0838585.1 beta-galactosidase [Streptococcus acidominimus]OLF49522.1 beta-galactosidase [Streptococcus acidominimus]TFU31566.1 beta-galactosidase [Streptococcus acidominimus]
MSTFQIREEFYINDQPFKILSGAIHYFRVQPDDWYHSLYNLKALGFNTVETYVPWNLHEPQKGVFTTEGILDIERFLSIAQELGLYAIVRPSPYICAEWEWGGLPAWLLTEQVRVRSRDEAYLRHVDDYYAFLLPKLAKYQLSQGGNILMFQVENEYGSYGEDKEYLRAIAALMRKYGLTAPFFTSDGSWRATLRAGTLIDEDILVTANFGSNASGNFEQLQAFFDEHDKKWPLMCMEFWDGWFNRWGEEVIRRDPNELAQAVMEAVELGSINLYMFHGGTNFGFMNGCSARGQIDLPQITSYDYDAILDEAGNPTKKFYALQALMKEAYPQLDYAEPLVKEARAYPTVSLNDKVSLFAALENVSDCQSAFYPKSMEELGQNVGYTYYKTRIEKDKSDDEYLRIIDARDRVQVFIDGQKIATQYQEEIGEEIHFQQADTEAELGILVENMGRVNYGHKLTAPTQYKGLGRGVIADLHFIGQWDMYPLPLDRLEELAFTEEWDEEQPAFYRYHITIEHCQDTYLDMTGFGKGVVFVNQQNIGRFWERGPLLSLYIPKGYLKKGENEIIVFETEGKYRENLRFSQEHVYKDL